MIIDVNKIKLQGKTEDEFSLIYTPTRQLLDLPDAQIEGGVKVDVTARLVGKKVEVEGEVSYLVVGVCSRCLDRAEALVKEEIFVEYDMAVGSEYCVKAGKIDLTEPVEEIVLTSSPMVIYCKDDCKGVCLNCGVNLNTGTCNCNTNNEVK